MHRGGSTGERYLIEARVLADQVFVIATYIMGKHSRRQWTHSVALRGKYWRVDPTAIIRIGRND